MPCTGPSHPTDLEVQIIFDSVMKHLQKKHNIFVYPPPGSQGFIDQRKKIEKELKEALKNILYQEYCESW